MQQFSFEFDPPRPAQPAATPPTAPAAEPSLEAMAQRLEQHPDFRVLRRLVPILDFGPAASPTTARQRVLVLDTETTGLSHPTDRIIELAMLLVEVDTACGLPVGPVACFEGFEDPGMPIPPVAREVTGITDEMVKGHRLDDPQVEAMVAQADLIVAHNAGFDRPFVEARFPCFAGKAWACSFMDIDWKAAGAGSSKLSALANDQGWFYDAHRALVDCHALLHVLAKPVGKSATTGLSQLIAAASRPSFKLRATGSPFESKDKLKGRGYRWDADAKVWTCTLASQEQLDAELAWLKAEVYGRRAARLEIEVLDSLVRYSARRGEAADRSL
jgi:DNA polymerase-3 subunit epsilon